MLISTRFISFLTSTLLESNFNRKTFRLTKNKSPFFKDEFYEIRNVRMALKPSGVGVPQTGVAILLIQSRPHSSDSL